MVVRAVEGCKVGRVWTGQGWRWVVAAVEGVDEPRVEMGGGRC